MELITVFLVLVAVSMVVLGARVVMGPPFPDGCSVGGTLLVLCGVLLCLAVLGGPAKAATLEIADTRVDLTELMLTLAGVAAAAIAMLARYALRALERYLEHRTGLELDAETRRYLDDALFRAVAYARLRVADMIREGRPGIDVRSETLAIAANYALDSVPDALARFGLDEDGDRLKAMLEARLASLFGNPDDPAEPASVLVGPALR